MNGPLTPEVRAAAARSVLCWFATDVAPSDPGFARWVAPLRAYGVVGAAPQSPE